MSETVYDRNVQVYLDFVDNVLATEPSPFLDMLDDFTRLLSGRLDDARVLDLACGEGYASRFFAPLVTSVVGVDIAAELITVARQRTDASNVTFAVGDAQTLEGFDDASIDIVVSQMALMDIPDHAAVFRAVRRVLVDGGAFVCSLLHPAFESPHNEPDEPRAIFDDNGFPRYILVNRYAQEGHWQSGASGLRGHVGSHHRMLSTYVNDLIDAGFAIARVEEPLMRGPNGTMPVPRMLIVSATASSLHT